MINPFFLIFFLIFLVVFLDNHVTTWYNKTYQRKGGRPMSKPKKKESLFNQTIKAIIATAALIGAIAQLIQALK
jgi:hypothetical protein